MVEFCTVELSSFYYEIVKDRLYAEAANSLLRRSSQTVLWHLLNFLPMSLSPIAYQLSEEIFKHAKEKDSTLKSFESIFHKGWSFTV